MYRHWNYKNEHSELSSGIHLLAAMFFVSSIVLLLANEKDWFQTVGCILLLASVVMMSLDFFLCSSVYAHRYWHRYLKVYGFKNSGVVEEIFKEVKADECGKQIDEYRFKVSFRSLYTCQRVTFVTEPLAFVPVMDGKYVCSVYEAINKPYGTDDTDWFGDYVADEFKLVQ